MWSLVAVSREEGDSVSDYKNQERCHVTRAGYGVPRVPPADLPEPERRL